MPYYCTVPRCTSMAGKTKNVSFHQFPKNKVLAEQWNTILRRGKPYTIYSKVCSLHFKPEDYVLPNVAKAKGQWRSLRKDAMPSQNLPGDSPVKTPQRRQPAAPKEPNPPNEQADADPLQMQPGSAQDFYMRTMLAIHAVAVSDQPTPAADGEEAAGIRVKNGNVTSPRDNFTELHDYILQYNAAKLDFPFRSHRTIDAKSIEARQKENMANPKREYFRCKECSRCFKDPDVYTLHKRSHKLKEDHCDKSVDSDDVKLKAEPCGNVVGQGSAVTKEEASDVSADDCETNVYDSDVQT